MIVLIALIAPLQLAHAAPYAGIVVDMRDGSVLDSENADNRQHPASLTKMMTLYLAFEAIEHGQLSLDQKVRVSRHAARRPPSKLYLKVGQRVSIRSLIRAAAVKSANDAATALAEAISGSEKEFAKLMTERARQLGMASTTFRNPHGLTQQGHLSTARDMALLARRLYFDFPQYYNIFGRKSARAAGKRIWTTNSLLSTYRGSEGMKTGYTRAAGYNLVAVAARGRERVIAVVMGGKSSRTRNAQVAKLLDRGFRRAPSRVAIVPPRDPGVRVASAPMPLPRPSRGGERAPTGLAALGEVLAPSAQAAAPAETGKTLAFATVPSARPSASPEASGAYLAMEAVPSSNARLAKAGPAAPAVDLLPSRAAVSTALVPRARPKPRWAVQTGAYGNHEQAVASIAQITLSDLDMLQAAESRIDEVTGRRGKLYRVRFLGLEPNQAREACKALKQHGQDCMMVAPRRR